MRVKIIYISSVAWWVSKNAFCLQHNGIENCAFVFCFVCCCAEQQILNYNISAVDNTVLSFKLIISKLRVSIYLNIIRFFFLDF
jgi:hypothetical protein